MSDDLNDNPVVRKLLDQLQRLESRVVQLEAQLSEHNGPLGRLAIVRQDPDTGGWQEYTVVDGALVPFTGGRASSGGDGAALLDMTGYQVVLEIPDRDRHRYVPVDSGIKDVQYNTTTDKLQVSYVFDPTTSDWVDKITFNPC